MTERITIAKTDMTMLLRVRVGFQQPGGSTHHDHACITPTTGFISTDGVCGGVRVVPGLFPFGF
jgi:hypothetical protein